MPRNWTLSDLQAKTALPAQNLPKPDQGHQPKGETRVKAVKPRQNESQQQTECVEWFRQAFPQYARILYSVPNGGYRSKRTAATMQREGQIPGIPDLCLAVPRHPYHGLYLELKAGKNKPTANQTEIMALLTEQGYLCRVIYSTEEFKETIQNYLTAA